MSTKRKGEALGSKSKKGPTGSEEKIQAINRIKELIQIGMSKYMTQAEIISALKHQHDIKPSDTCLVWSKLEDQNKEFFFSYGIRLRLKDQVAAFNYLSRQQKTLGAKLRGGGG